MRKGLLATALASLLSIPTPAFAGMLLYDVSGGTGTLGQWHRVRFKIDANPIPDSFSEEYSFRLNNVLVRAGGAVVPRSVNFYHDYSNGGIVIAPWLGTDGPQLYSGTESNPTMLTGTFVLIDLAEDGGYTLTVTPTVPAPDTLALVAMGFAAIGLVRRRRPA